MESTALLEHYLKTLCLPSFVRAYRQCADDAARTNQSYERFLLALAEQEIQHRDHQRQIRLTRAARFPVAKDLADFDFASLPELNKAQVLDLAQGHYIPRHETVILVGHPGLGKTHIALGLGHAACRQGYRVRFVTAAALVNELIAAQDAHRVDKLIAQALKQELIIIDELGFIPFSEHGSQLIFQYCSALYERVAIMVTTNLRFAEWTQVFGSERLTAALLDRLTHRATILEFRGDSYRFRQRLQQANPPAALRDPPALSEPSTPPDPDQAAGSPPPPSSRQRR